MRHKLTIVNSWNCDLFRENLCSIYENSPWIAEQTWWHRPFKSREDLAQKMNLVVEQADPKQQLALIRAHPDLVGRFAQQGKLTASSLAEQKGAGLMSLPEELIARFELYNRRYKENFGFPFVICARLNDAGSILEAFERRLQFSRQEEMATALAEIKKIAALRLAELIEDDAP
jgi:2-oxo-4-hydroxy-4-carboxy-5-ureidoimidazoline decarboxylase